MFSLSSKPSDRSRAEYIASVEATRRKAALEEERKQRERLNLASTKEYPALGGGSVKSPALEAKPATWQKPPVIAGSAEPVKKAPSKRVVSRATATTATTGSTAREDTEPMEPIEINPDLFPSSRRRGDIW